MPSVTTALPISRFLDPTLVLLVVLGIALIAQGSPSVRRWPGRVAILGWAMLWLLATPVFADALVFATETQAATVDSIASSVGDKHAALVVLAGGLRTSEPAVPPRERLDAATTQRVLGAARLYLAKPFELVILSGGPPPVTDAMADLIHTLGVPDSHIVRETLSDNTRENASFSAKILGARHVDCVVLVTSASHMRRSVMEFNREQVRVIPFPVDVFGAPRWEPQALFPSSRGLVRAAIALHEILGWVRA